jgi:hypothetical protein
MDTTPTTWTLDLLGHETREFRTLRDVLDFANDSVNSAILADLFVGAFRVTRGRETARVLLTRRGWIIQTVR